MYLDFFNWDCQGKIHQNLFWSRRHINQYFSSLFAVHKSNVTICQCNGRIEKSLKQNHVSFELKFKDSGEWKDVRCHGGIHSRNSTVNSCFPLKLSLVNNLMTDEQLSELFLLRSSVSAMRSPNAYLALKSLSFMSANL